MESDSEEELPYDIDDIEDVDDVDLAFDIQRHGLPHATETIIEALFNPVKIYGYAI
jgi:hypothetical protein